MSINQFLSKSFLQEWNTSSQKISIISSSKYFLSFRYLFCHLFSLNLTVNLYWYPSCHELAFINIFTDSLVARQIFYPNNFDIHLIFSILTKNENPSNLFHSLLLYLQCYSKSANFIHHLSFPQVQFLLKLWGKRFFLRSIPIYPLFSLITLQSFL